MQLETKTPTKNSVMLLLTALIWGTAFVAQRVGMDYMGPFAFSAVRCTLGGLVLIPVIFLLRRLQKGERAQEVSRKATLMGGLICGVILTVASNLQQIGIKYTTVGKAGFITAMYILIVPILGIFLKRRAGLKLWISVAIAIVGLYLLCMKGSFSLEMGDTLICLCALVFSVHILVIDHFSPKADGVMMSCIQFLVTGLLSAVCMVFAEPLPTLEIIVACRVPILYTGILSCGVAYTLQILGQKNVNPTVASLILSLEAVISVIAAWIILGQSMTAREMLGAALMFGAIILAQLPERVKTPSPAKELLEQPSE